MTQERRTVTGRISVRADKSLKRGSDDALTFVFDGVGDITGATTNFRLLDRPGGTVLLTKTNTTHIDAANSKSQFTITPADKQGLSTDDKNDAVLYYYTVDLVQTDTTVWFEGDCTIQPDHTL